MAAQTNCLARDQELLYPEDSSSFPEARVSGHMCEETISEPLISISPFFSVFFVLSTHYFFRVLEDLDSYTQPGNVCAALGVLEQVMSTTPSNPVLSSVIDTFVPFLFFLPRR